MDHQKAELSFQGFVRVVDLQGRPSSCPLRPQLLRNPAAYFGDIDKWKEDEFPAGVCVISAASPPPSYRHSGHRQISVMMSWLRKVPYVTG